MGDTCGQLWQSVIVVARAPDAVGLRPALAVLVNGPQKIGDGKPR
ncbi:hypothetical protein [Micromonospora sp. M61]|nr:hypothetical protein [Micromonospora sp. M61]